jgi:hypothetical protein
MQDSAQFLVEPLQALDDIAAGLATQPEDTITNARNVCATKRYFAYPVAMSVAGAVAQGVASESSSRRYASSLSRAASTEATRTSSPHASAYSSSF